MGNDLEEIAVPRNCSLCGVNAEGSNTAHVFKWSNDPEPTLFVRFCKRCWKTTKEAVHRWKWEADDD